MAKVNIVMDMSQYDLFLLCNQRFYNSHKLHKGLPTKAAQLDRGTLVHVGAEFYYEGIRQGMQYQDCVNTALMKIKEASVISSDLEPEQVNRVIEVMEEYFDHWRFQDQTFQIIEVEKSFLKLLYEDDEVRIHLAGKIDLLISDNRYTNKPMDHKSRDKRHPVPRLSNQFRCYCWATESNYLEINYIGFQTSLKAEEKFIRTPFTVDPFKIEQWKSNVVHNIFKYLECEATGIWPMNETSCDKYFRECEFMDVCDSSGEEAKLYKLASNYIDIEPWDVTKILKKSSQILEK